MGANKLEVFIKINGVMDEGFELDKLSIADLLAVLNRIRKAVGEEIEDE